MIQSLINLFIQGGNSTLLFGSASSPSISTTFSDETLQTVLSDDSPSTSTSLTITSISSALINSASAMDIETQVEDTQMIIESMSIEELSELKELIIEKGSSLTLHKD